MHLRPGAHSPFIRKSYSQHAEDLGQQSFTRKAI